MVRMFSFSLRKEQNRPLYIMSSVPVTIISSSVKFQILKRSRLFKIESSIHLLVLVPKRETVDQLFGKQVHS